MFEKLQNLTEVFLCSSIGIRLKPRSGLCCTCFLVCWSTVWQHLGCFSVVIYYYAATAAAKSLQSCPTLCNPIDGSPPGFPVPGILQARTLEWVAISFSNAWTWRVKVKSLSHVRLLATSWTAAYQAPPSSPVFLTVEKYPLKAREKVSSPEGCKKNRASIFLYGNEFSLHFQTINSEV